MKNNYSRVLSMALLGVTVFTLGNNATYAQTIKETTTAYRQNTAMHKSSPFTFGKNPNANVEGDGVALRSKPSTSGSRLELMYDNEELIIDFDTSYEESNGSWFYVKRVKTGTIGWISADYISIWVRNMSK